MTYARAVANNDVILLAWDPGGPIDGCLGFDVRRRELGKRRASLPAWVGFAGDDPASGPRTTMHWPIQKYTWRDLTARPGATYSYDIVPMIGEPGALRRGRPVLTTNPVTLSPHCSEHVDVYFNRGILATQHLSRIVPRKPDGEPDFAVLRTRLGTPGDRIRAGLAHQLIEGVSSLLHRAAMEGGHCFAALYELADPELVQLLVDSTQVSLVLSNAGVSDTSTDATNEAARAALHAAAADLTDRLMSNGHIGHNKFIVYVDPAGVPQSVLTGSTNWTSTGLCCQTNNSVIVHDSAVAADYLDYWHRIKAESTGPTATQSAAFRLANRAATTRQVDAGTVTLRMSPNTTQQNKPANNPARPVDLVEVFGLIAAATRGVLFLLFQPGSPSVLDAVLDAQDANPQLFVRGAATDANAIGKYDTELFHRTGSTARVAAASAIQDDFAFWQRELLKLPGAHAVVHDKIVVIDPFTDDSVVVTGSHNLGYRASYNNDDNLLIIRGNRGVTDAYASHVLDVYDHYRWRWVLAWSGKRAWTGLRGTPAWQAKYLSPGIREEFAFFARG